MTEETEVSKETRSSQRTTAEASAPRPEKDLNTLRAFAAAQRQIAGVNFAALAQGQRAVQAQAAQTAEFVAARDAISNSFSRSIDLSRIATIHKVLDANQTNITAAVQQWTKSLNEAIDYSVLQVTAALVDSSAMTRAMEGLKLHTDAFERVSDTITSWVSRIDFSSLDLDRWLPENLQGIQDEDLDLVASIALDEGLPLSWGPRTDIVVSLIEADGPNERCQILNNRKEDILDDCEGALGPISHEWAIQTRSAITALRHGFHGPAQSHASNIVDSIVLAVLGRVDALDRAQEDLDHQFLHLVAEHLTLRPLFRAFTTWYPGTGTSPPSYFARHTTSHAVGLAGIFDPLYALIGIMLATSLTIQFRPNDQEPPGHS